MILKLKKFISQSTINKLKHWPQAWAAVSKFGQPARGMCVIGVTGTDGKTTTSSLIYQILQTAKLRSGMITTIEAEINGQHYDTGFHTTTPDAWNLQRLLKQAKSENVSHMVIEATSIGLDQHRLLGIPFQIGVLTNITHDHLDYHKTYENYLLAKAKLFDKVKFAILNQDDRSYLPMQEYLHAKNPLATVLSCSLENDQANFRATNIALKENGLSFICKVTHPQFAARELKFKVESKLMGEFNVYNLLTAIAAGFALGLSVQEIVRAIGNYQQVSGRQEHWEIKGRKVLIDFAHTPNAFDAFLKSVRKIFPKERILLMFGATGERDTSKRPLMGELACNLADVVVFTSDDTYHEPIGQIHRQLLAGAKLTKAICIEENAKLVKGKHVYLVIKNRQEAANYLARVSKKGDVIVMLGKGHERTINLGGIEYPWSEREAILKAFNEVES